MLLEQLVKACAPFRALPCLLHIKASFSDLFLSYKASCHLPGLNQIFMPVRLNPSTRFNTFLIMTQVITGLYIWGGNCVTVFNHYSQPGPAGRCPVAHHIWLCSHPMERAITTSITSDITPIYILFLLSYRECLLP